jgi:hypothetical protein
MIFVSRIEDFASPASKSARIQGNLSDIERLARARGRAEIRGSGVSRRTDRCERHDAPLTIWEVTSKRAVRPSARDRFPCRGSGNGAARKIVIQRPEARQLHSPFRSRRRTGRSTIGSKTDRSPRSGRSPGRKRGGNLVARGCSPCRTRRRNRPKDRAPSPPNRRRTDRARCNRWHSGIGCRRSCRRARRGCPRYSP